MKVVCVFGAKTAQVPPNSAFQSNIDMEYDVYDKNTPKAATVLLLRATQSTETEKLIPNTVE
jgi:hypothetical protein